MNLQHVEKLSALRKAQIGKDFDSVEHAEYIAELYGLAPFLISIAITFFSTKKSNGNPGN